MKRSAHDLTKETKAKRQAIITREGQIGHFQFPPLSGTSKQICDRESIFQAFFIPVREAQDVPSIIESFKNSSICDKADHVMVAYRCNDAEIGVDTGYNDDGERFSGDKLQNLLHVMDAYGLVICIREYGGIMLGPIRFQHITQCARESIMVHRYKKSQSSDELAKLRRLLVARDRSILALRAILNGVDVVDNPSQRSDTDRESIAGSQGTGHAYDTQDIERLRRLLFARDRTIQSLRQALPVAGKSP